MEICDDYELKGNTIVFNVKNELLVHMIKDRFRNDITRLENKGIKVEFRYPAKEIYYESFNNFFYGKENEFTVLALKSLITNSVYYRVAVLFGDSGLGKTHLLKALANESLKLSKKPVYFSAHKVFTTLLDSYRQRKKPDFDFLKGAEVILIDDLHLVSNRSFVLDFISRLMDKVETTKKVLIMASQGNINSFSGNRSFKTRLMSSLRVSLSIPSVGVRKRIFISACDRFGVSPNISITNYVSENITNPRAIIGAATRFKAYYDVYGKYPETDEFMEIIEDLCDEESLDIFKVFGKGKPGIYVAALFLKKMGKSSKEISEMLGCSRSSVYNYIERAKEVLKKDKNLERKFNELVKEFQFRRFPPLH